MKLQAHTTAAYRIIRESNGTRYRFFCEVSGASVITTSVFTEPPSDELRMQVWNREARNHFNLCHQCGRWVCDVMYNADTLKCVECSPWENPPHYCSHCGNPVPKTDIYCRKCGTRLMYGGDSHDENS